MYLCENRKAPGTAYRQTECTGCQQGSPKDFPALILPQRAGIYIQSSFFIKKSNLRKERGKNHEFFYIKQLMAGGGIVIVAQTVIPQLTSLFS